MCVFMEDNIIIPEEVFCVFLKEEELTETSALDESFLLSDKRQRRAGKRGRVGGEEK